MLKKVTAVLIVFVFCLCFIPMPAVHVNADTRNSNIPTVGTASADPDFAAGIYNTGSTGSGGGVSAMAVGLIGSVSLALYHDGGNTIRLEARTIGTEVLNKIGFQDIKLQRWQNSQWVNVKVWSTYRYNSATYAYESITNVTPGYDYRYTAVHYAEKDWLIFPSVQTFYNETSYLYIG